MGDAYLSTCCNSLHDVATGVPIDHECCVIPPAALKAEMDEDFPQKRIVATGTGRIEDDYRNRQLFGAECEEGSES